MSIASVVSTTNSMGLKRDVLGTDAKHMVAGSLQATLVDLIDLAMQTKQAHWGVIGALFVPVHEKLDEFHAAYLEAIDEVAERMTAINAAPDGRIQAVAETSELEPFPVGAVKAPDVVRLMADRVAAVVDRIRSREETVNQLDPVTTDVFVGILGALEKQLWMLQAEER